MIQGAYAASAGTQVINAVGLHETYLIMPTGGALDTTITNFQVKVAGQGVVTDINSNSSLLTISDFAKKQSLSVLTKKGYMVPAADGFIPNKNVQILITKSGAGTAGTILGFSQAYGKMYCQIINQSALQSSGMDFKKFLFLVLEGATSSDRFNLTFKDDFNHQAELDELITDCTWSQVQNDQLNVMIGNQDQRYSKVNYIPAATRQVYIARFAPADQPLLNILSND